VPVYEVDRAGATADGLSEDGDADQDADHGEHDEHELGVAEFGRFWRGTPVDGASDGAGGEHGTDRAADGPASSRYEPVTVAGGLHHGGWVVVMTATGLLLPTAPLRVPLPSDHRDLRRTTVEVDHSEAWRPPPGVPVEPARTAVPALPVTLRPRIRDRLADAIQGLALVGAPVAVALGYPDTWFRETWTLVLGWWLGLAGVRGLVRFIRIDRTGLTITRGLVTQVVPWQRLHGIRRDGKDLLLAWELDVVPVPGPFARVRALAEPNGARSTPTGTAERAGALMMRLRELSLAAGDPGVPITSRRAGSLGLFAGYLVLALIALWIHHGR
jgi:hypothetical protein